MTLKKLIAALGVAALTLPALAHVPLSVDPVNGVAPDIEVNIAGASASDAQIEALITNSPGQLCDPGTIDYFRNSGSSPGSSYRAFFCTMSTVAGIPAGSKVLVRKRSAGGSGQGARPVCDRIAQSFMKLQNTCTQTAPGSREWRCPTAATDLESLVAEVGVSDVGPNEIADASLTSANCASPEGSFALVFNTPVTKKLRDALQAAQGKTVGSETAANMPSLSLDQVRSIFTGRIQTWDDIKVRGNTLPAVAVAAGLPAPSSNRATVCRRQDSSGTFSTVLLHVLGGGACLGGSPLPMAAGTANPNATQIVTVNASGDVESCLDNLNNGVALAAGVNGVVNLPGGASSDWAIGMLSTEFNAPAGGPGGAIPKNYRYIRLDGVVPSIDNAAAGTYSYVMVSTIQQSTVFPPSAASTAIFNALRGAVDPNGIAAGNKTHDWGIGGGLALATAGFPIDPDNNNLFDPANPVWPYARSKSTAAPYAVNNCIGPYLLPGAVNVETQLGPNADNTLQGE